MWRLKPDTFASTSLPDAPPPVIASKPRSCPSLITIRLQVTFGLPFFLLSSGFQVNATVTRLLDSLLNMCPIYLQRLLRMVSLTGLVLVRRYSSSFEVFIGHLILMIFFKHTRWNLSSVMGYTDEWMESLAV